MKVICKSITEVHATDAEGQVRMQDVEVEEGKHEKEPIVESVRIELVDEKGAPVATLHLSPIEKHGLSEGGEYDSVLGHTYEHAAAE